MQSDEEKMKREPLVTVVILTYNGCDDTLECLGSLFKINYKNYRVVVVDNGSSDDSQIRIKKEYPQTILVRSEVNLGFPGGVNLGIKAGWDLNPEFFLLLNNDTTVDPSFLNEIVSASYSREASGIFSPIIYNYYEKDKFWFYTGRLSDLRGPVHKANVKATLKDDRPYEVTFISGCCMFVRKSLLEEIGLMDDRFFLYYDDADLCMRTLKNNWQLTVVPKSVIWHKDGASHKSAINKVRIYYPVRSRLLFCSKHYHGLKKAGCLSYFYVTRIMKFMQWLLKGEAGNIKYTILGVRDYHRKIWGKVKL